MIIGTHNSSAYQVDLSIPLHPTFSKWNVLRVLARVFPCVRKRVLELTENQILTIEQQLSVGTRFLDFYISYCARTDTYYCSHTYATIPLTRALLQIKSYLSEQHNLQIPLFILLNTDFETRATMTGRLNSVWTLVTSILPQNIYSITWSGNLVPVEMRASVYMDWYNVGTVPDFLARFRDADYKEEDDEKDGLFWILTPGKWNDPSLLSLSQQLNAKLVSEMSLRQVSNRPSIIAVDHISETLIKEIKSLE